MAPLKRQDPAKIHTSLLKRVTRVGSDITKIVASSNDAEYPGLRTDSAVYPTEDYLTKVWRYYQTLAAQGKDQKVSEHDRKTFEPFKGSLEGTDPSCWISSVRRDTIDTLCESAYAFANALYDTGDGKRSIDPAKSRADPQYARLGGLVPLLTYLGPDVQNSITGQSLTGRDLCTQIGPGVLQITGDTTTVLETIQEQLRGLRDTSALHDTKTTAGMSTITLSPLTADSKTQESSDTRSWRGIPLFRKGTTKMSVEERQGADEKLAAVIRDELHEFTQYIRSGQKNRQSKSVAPSINPANTPSAVSSQISTSQSTKPPSTVLPPPSLQKGPGAQPSQPQSGPVQSIIDTKTPESKISRANKWSKKKIATVSLAGAASLLAAYGLHDQSHPNLIRACGAPLPGRYQNGSPKSRRRLTRIKALPLLLQRYPYR